MIICKRPVRPDDHLQPQKWHEKCIFETLHKIKCVLSIKESNFKEERYLGKEGPEDEEERDSHAPERLPF